MKITKSRLKEIIKEEYNRAMREGSLLDDPDARTSHAGTSADIDKGAPCIQYTRQGTKMLYKGDPGYEECVQSKKLDERIPTPEKGEAVVKVPVSAMNKFKSDMEKIDLFYNRAYTIAHRVNIGPKVNANYFQEEGNERDQFMHLTPKSSRELTNLMRNIDKSLSQLFDTYKMTRMDYEEERYKASKRFDAEHALRDVGVQEE